MASTKTVVRYRNRVTKKRRRKNSTTLPLAVVAGLVAGLYTPATYLMSGDIKNTMRFTSRNYTGYDPMEGRFYAGDIKKGLVPLMVGGVIHKVAGKIGINRVIGKAGVPFIRI